MNVRHLAARIEPGLIRPADGAGTAQATTRPPSTTFAEELRRARDLSGSGEEPIRLSAHAQQRLEQRQIAFSDEDRQSIRAAVDTLSEKGARDAVLLRTDAAFVVNVPSRTVVTALDQDELHHRVFTQIDSAMLI